jgi:geranylgeranyl diphosphate synthase type II
LQKGAKRFRPILALLTTEALGQPRALSLPWAAAIECVHTYSLVHDDLPAMDDDRERRGQPTCHIKFGEGAAILAGDALLTEAFTLLADRYSAMPDVALELISLLGRASGPVGMVGGQALDLLAQAGLEEPGAEPLDYASLRRLHRLKTGALIRVAVQGAAVICRTGAAKTRDLVIYADLLGLAFQVQDDLHDFEQGKSEPGSFPALLGAERTRTLLAELTDGALGCLRVWGSEAEPLREIARFNQRRDK